jgi:hypothetical protein
LERIKEVRQIIKSKQWCGKVEIIESDVNKGLANSVIAGVSDVVNRFGKVIVIEDDVQLSPHLLRFMNDALNKYEHDEHVCGVGSCNYFCPPEVIGQNFFLRHPDTWAWATYARSWQYMETDSHKLLKELKDKHLEKFFNMENSINLMRMLRNQSVGKVDSWAVRWTAAMVLKGQLTLYPQYPLATHMGQESGTHFSGYEVVSDRSAVFEEHPLSLTDIDVKESPIAVKCYVNHNKKYHNIFVRGIATLRSILKM